MPDNHDRLNLAITLVEQFEAHIAAAAAYKAKDDGAWGLDPEQASMTGSVLTGEDVQRVAALVRGGELVEQVVFEIIRGCGWLNVRPRPDGATEYHYDGVMVLKGDAATYLDWVIEKVGTEK